MIGIAIGLEVTNLRMSLLRQLSTCPILLTACNVRSFDMFAYIMYVYVRVCPLDKPMYIGEREHEVDRSGLN